MQCQLCQHRCRIPEESAGFCAVRANKNGVLHSLIYGLVASAGLDPVEKKPLYHYLPGSKTYSFGTVGCNFACRFCQNHSTSRAPADRGILQGKRVSATTLIQEALRHEAKSISFTYNEPTVFYELMYDTAGQAAASGLDCLLVSNGYQSEECLASLYYRIRAANIDLKSMRDSFYREYCKARLTPVLDNLKTMIGMGWWVEVTTLLIPGINDSVDELRDMAKFICYELGPHVPWHISRFHGAYHMQGHPPTPLDTMLDAQQIGLDMGMHYVYLGNVGHSHPTHTLCPACKEVCIERQGFSSQSRLRGGNSCPQCGRAVEGIWS